MDTELSRGLVFDHVVIAVADLDAEAEKFLNRYGLASVDGGRHLGLGTANRIIPLGPDYLELLAVVDEDEATSSPLAMWVTSMQVSAALGALCLRTGDIDGVATALETQVIPMQRARPDGGTIEWKVAGLESTLGNPSLPFFIQWDCEPSDHPGAAAVAHPAGAPTLEWVEVSGSREALTQRLGNHGLDIRTSEGPPGVVAVGLRAASGPVTIRAKP